MIIYYSTRNELYYMRFLKFKNFGNAQKQEAEKSIRYEELSQDSFYPVKKWMSGIIFGSIAAGFGSQGLTIFQKML